MCKTYSNAINHVIVKEKIKKEVDKIMRKERKFNINNAKADLFRFYCAVNGIVITKVEMFDTFTRFYFMANDIDLMDATNFCEQYIKKQPERKPEISRIIVIIL